MSFTPAEIRRLKDAFNEAVKNHPQADEPAVGFGNKTFSARELAKEIENETPVGQMFIKIIEQAVSSGAITLDDMIAKMTQKPPQP